MFNRHITSTMKLPWQLVLATVFYFCIQLLSSSIVESVRLGELNHNCVLVTDCRTPAYYCGRNKTCQCARYHIPNAMGTICIGAIGEKCRYDKHCGERAFCSPKEVCQCEFEYPYATQDGYVCTDAAANVNKSTATFLIVTVFAMVLNYLRIY